MEPISHAIADYLVQQSWQLTAVFVLVLLLNWALRNASAHWRYLLWLVVVAKCVLPPVCTLPFAVLPPHSQSETNRYTADAATATGGAATQPLPDAPRRIESPNTAHPTQYIATPLSSASHSADSTQCTSRAWLVMLWLATVIVTLTSIGGKAWKTDRRLRQSRTRADNDTCVLIATLAKRLGMRHLPTIYLADSVAQPFVWGWGRGDIYVSSHFVYGTSAEQREAILTHELAHVCRWDCAANNVQLFAQAIFFFHPLVWWANKKIRQEREKCCDEFVLADKKTRPQLYCEAIVEMLTMEFKARHASPGLAVTGSTKNIEDRIVTILTPGRSFRRRPSTAAVATIIGVATLVLPISLALTTQAEPSNDAAPKTAASAENTFNASTPTKNAWTPGQVIDVRVINTQTKEPIPGVTLELQNMGPGINFGDVKKSTTDADGHSLVKLCDLPPTAVRIYPSKPGFVPLRVYWEGKPSPAMPKSITIPLEPGKAFGGTIRNEAGEPIPDVLVSIDYWATGSGKNPHIRDNINHKTKTDKDGHWHVDIMPATVESKKLQIYLTHPNYISDHLKRGFAPNPITEQPPLKNLYDQTAEMVMKKGETLAGRVTNTDGQPIPNAKIYNSTYYWFSPGRPAAETDQEGKFHISGLKPGDAPQTPHNVVNETQLTVEAPGYAPEMVDVDDLNSEVQVRLQPGHTIEGRIIDDDGKPVKDVEVNAVSWRHQNSRLHLEAKSGADGTFKLTDTPDEEVQFDFMKDGYMNVDNFSMSPSGGKYAVVMMPPVEITGAVVDAETGKPIDKFLMIGGAGYDDGRAPGWMGASSETILDGRYKITLRQKGFPNLIRIEADGYMPAESRVIRPYNPDKGKITCDFKLHKAEPLTGTVLGLDGKPLASADVYLAANEMTIDHRKVVYTGLMDRKMSLYQNNSVTKTDKEGHFQFPPEVEPFCLVVVHEQGVALLTEQDFESSVPIAIKEWTDQNQTLQIVRRPSTETLRSPIQFP